MKYFVIIILFICSFQAYAEYVDIIAYPSCSSTVTGSLSTEFDEDLANDYPNLYPLASMLNSLTELVVAIFQKPVLYATLVPKVLTQ